MARLIVTYKNKEYLNPSKRYFRVEKNGEETQYSFKINADVIIMFNAHYLIIVSC